MDNNYIIKYSQKKGYSILCHGIGKEVPFWLIYTGPWTRGPTVQYPQNGIGPNFFFYSLNHLKQENWMLTENFWDGIPVGGHF